jgi:hypothetical protein
METILTSSVVEEAVKRPSRAGRVLGAAKTALRQLSGDHSPLEMPWTRTSGASAEANGLHRVVLALEWRAAATRGARALLVARALAWPVASLLRALRLLRRHGPVVARRHGVGLARQLWDQVTCANLLNVGPDSYYKYRLFLPANRRRALEFVQHFEASRIGQERVRQLGAFELDDKVSFHDRCLALGLATVPVLATFEGGRLNRWGGATETGLPPLDLILKPCNLDSGEGVECWRYDAARRAWCREGVEREDLLEHARSSSVARRCLLQPRLENHADLAPLSAGGLCTVRVLTCLGADGRPVLVNGVLNFPTGQSDINNFSSGGLAAAVDPATGALGLAFGYDPSVALLASHPTTGAAVAGRLVPGWRAMVDLCLAAHAHFPGLHSIGWDVAPTPHGPLLLEANTIWDIDLAQMATGQPLAAVFRADGVVERHLASAGATAS